MKEITVTTLDISRPYTIIGPVFYSLTNKGLFSSQFDKLKKKYKELLEARMKEGKISDDDVPWSNIVGDYMATQNDFDNGFVIAVEELKERTMKVDADAIIGFRYDLDFDAKSSHEFFIQVTGTAVKFISNP